MPFSCNGLYKALTRRKFIPDDSLVTTQLNRCLGIFDLTFLGVGSTLGLGIYILVGQIAAKTAGPAVSISYLIAAIASVFAALCYAEFGARVPKTGSAYVYSYVTVGEFMAFIIGWNLVLEYVIGTASVARGYSNYIDSLFNEAMAKQLNQTVPIHISGLSSFPDFLAFGITIFLTVLLAFGVKESSRFNNVCTVLNLLLVTYVVICGLFKVDTHNWHLTPQELPSPRYGTGGYFPYGIRGVISGAATCFYGYVGFDVIATTGEEARNPQKAIPIAIISSLFIVFVAYFSVSTIQTLMWPYFTQDVPAPLPFVFQMVGYPFAKWVITVGALTGLSTSLLGGMFPLPRILYAMAKDGLIFRFLASTHSKFKTPLFATFISGVFTGFMAMIFDVDKLANMMSIGTLLAYTLVALCVLILRYRIDEEVIPMGAVNTNNIEESNALETSSVDRSESVTGSPYYIRKMAKKNMNSITSSTNTLLASTQYFTYRDVLKQIFNSENIDVQTKLSSKVSMMLIYVIVGLVTIIDILLTVFDSKVFDLDPFVITPILFLTVLLLIAIIALKTQPVDNKNLSFRVPWVPFIPVLSIFVNFNLMLRLNVDTWKRFGYWMIAGLLIYFGYGMWHSSERRSPPPPLPPLMEGSLSESEEDAIKTENSPLLAEN